jgi:hypothetical protein
MSGAPAAAGRLAGMYVNTVTLTCPPMPKAHAGDDPEHSSAFSARAPGSKCKGAGLQGGPPGHIHGCILPHGAVTHKGTAPMLVWLQSTGLHTKTPPTVPPGDALHIAKTEGQRGSHPTAQQACLGPCGRLCTTSQPPKHTPKTPVGHTHGAQQPSDPPCEQ